MAALHSPIRTCAPRHSYILTVRKLSHPEERAVQTLERNQSKQDQRTRAIPKNQLGLLWSHGVGVKVLCSGRHVAALFYGSGLRGGARCSLWRFGGVSRVWPGWFGRCKAAIS